MAAIGLFPGGLRVSAWHGDMARCVRLIVCRMLSSAQAHS